jgi:hypothetical protein
MADNPGCLDHDSYIELRGVLEVDVDYVQTSILDGDARILAPISVTTAMALAEEVAKAITLNEREKALIVGNLKGFASQ